MRFFTARSVSLAALVPALLLFAFVPGCAKQSEGERCGDDNFGADSSDCDDGLICKTIGASNYRCCYPDTRFTDSRCEAPMSVGTAGGANGGSANGDAGSGDGSEAGGGG
ncbi:MAG TPA: hypothetical protein VER11_13215 [Polyangiaceae bacterium]|nr:hypothetical protein [Polyangiaceae bacterium]